MGTALVFSLAASACRARYPGIRDIALSRDHSYVQMENGNVYRLQGKKGAELVKMEWFPSFSTPDAACRASLPAEVSDVVEFHCGDDFGCARRKNGTVACWGDNTRYQLARPGRSAAQKPELVFGVLQATRLFVGPQSACVTLREGGAKCWGANESGQLGDGRAEDHNVPVYIRILKGG